MDPEENGDVDENVDKGDGDVDEGDGNVDENEDNEVGDTWKNYNEEGKMVFVSEMIDVIVY